MSKKSDVAEATSSAENANITFDLPEGFQEVSDFDELAGFFHFSPGNSLTGKILSFHEFTDKEGEDRQRFHILLTKPGAICNVRVGEGDDTSYIQSEVEEGSIIGVNGVAGLKPLIPYTDEKNAGRFEVFLGIKGKVKIKGKKKTRWDIVKAVREIPDTETPF